MATDARLTKTERNSVFKLVVQHGFDPTEFGWTEETSRETPYEASVYRKSVLTHHPTERYFKFGGEVYECSPGKTKTVHRKTRPDYPVDQLPIVYDWLWRVRQEYDAPDLWAMALEDRRFLQAASVLEGMNTEFTVNERAYISARLDEIRAFLLASADLANEQRELIAAQFEYVKEATKRLGRLDWKQVLVGTIIGMAINATVTPDRAQQLWHMIADAFTPLYKVVGLIP